MFNIYGRWLVVMTVLTSLSSVASAGVMNSWKMAKAPLLTRWDKEVSPTHALVHYPRPQMRRAVWKNLNGLWNYAITPARRNHFPGRADGEILVPYPVQSALSGVMKYVGPHHAVWYRRTFSVPKNWRHVLLHFGAVNWKSSIYVNGHKLGVHRGGYDSFSYNITPFLKSSGRQELTLKVVNPVNTGVQPRGKQTLHPGGIFYTASTGIWQTVWLEPVSRNHITHLVIVPHVGQKSVAVTVDAAAGTARVVVLDGITPVAGGTGPVNRPVAIRIPHPKLWWPSRPFLYNLDITLTYHHRETDFVRSYFGMRSISIGKVDGCNRILLNGKFIFGRGVLDQGFWPDGLYTAPTDRALRYDLVMEKKLGFNLVRKHQKIEPDRWYYWADRLGLMVWQDMPACFFKGRLTVGQAAQFKQELGQMIHDRENHPCIVDWVIFNEGWGEHDVRRLVRYVHRLDPSRLITDASGWVDRGVGNINDTHHYTTPWCNIPSDGRASVSGEFGGLGRIVKRHMWVTSHLAQYQGFTTESAELTRFRHLWREAWALEKTPGAITKVSGATTPPWWAKGRGDSAVIYTQITDVEDEINGLMTYDRAVVKMPVREIAKAVRGTERK